MTQEEKAKAYDKAIKVAESIHRFSSDSAEIKRMEQIFPELAESEDERIRQFLIGYFSVLVDENSEWGLNQETRSKILVWLERQAQKQEWSEEYKNMLKWVIGYLENKMLNAPISEERTACKNAIAWLKSLRPQSQWKPSDEQVKALEESIMFLGTSWVSTRQFALESLYQELKKLRDE